MLASEFIVEYNITVAFKSNGSRTVDGWEHFLWNAYVTNEFGRTERFSYRTGIGHGEPTATGLLYCLASDCRIFEEHANGDEVAATFGMEDTSAAEHLYDACNATSTTLYDLFTPDSAYQDLLSIEDE